MRYLLMFSLLIISFNLMAKETETVHLKYSTVFILNKLLEHKNLTYDSHIQTPLIFMKSKTSLKQFQDAIEIQWGQRPNEFTNAYAVARNEIYLLDDADYYKRNERCIDDSLAHELTHFVQVKYQHFDINDESLEWDAVDFQTWFRDNFCK